ncbi:MAG: MarR family transcriptional regulator [Porticoccaceae bacterium]|jgi:MarR family transcriptional regulator, organic hydroperoxide resistance regulator|nr:MarR family transcriptional regulator [Porticoccaceae bacterium]
MSVEEDMDDKDRVPASGASKEHEGLAPEESIAFLTKGLYRDFAKALERRLSTHNINIGMWYPLRLLWIEDGQYQHELQKKVGIAQPTLVTALDRLENRGFILRKRSTLDKRHVNIFLTEAGRDLEHEILHYANEIQNLASEGISSSELESFMAVIHKLKKSLQKDLQNSN